MRNQRRLITFTQVVPMLTKVEFNDAIAKELQILEVLCMAFMRTTQFDIVNIDGEMTVSYDRILKLYRNFFGRLDKKEKRPANSLHHQNDYTYLRIHTMYSQIKKVQSLLQTPPLPHENPRRFSSRQHQEIKYRTIAILDLYADIPKPTERKRKRPRGRKPIGKIWHQDYGWVDEYE